MKTGKLQCKVVLNNGQILSCIYPFSEDMLLEALKICAVIRFIDCAVMVSAISAITWEEM